MRLYDIYMNLKADYLDAIVVIKNGKFYLSYDNDALILSYLLGYKKINNKVGFPDNALSNVINVFKQNKISYVIKDFDKNLDLDNQYYSYLKKANDDVIINNMCESLLSKMKEKVRENTDNYEKIARYINEL